MAFRNRNVGPDILWFMRNRLALLKFMYFYFSLDFANKMEFLAWWRRGFQSPAPHFVKMRVLSSASKVDAWVETGTYMGRTTGFLQKSGSRVVSIEPSEGLAKKAKDVFESASNVLIVTGLSEFELEKIIDGFDPEIRKIAFWLDGHFSGGPTHLGPVETPIQRELEIIAEKLHKFEKVTIFIDDFRCFVNQEKDYPSTNMLSSWASDNNLSWSVEHDIFIART